MDSDWLLLLLGGSLVQRGLGFWFWVAGGSEMGGEGSLWWIINQRRNKER